MSEATATSDLLNPDKFEMGDLFILEHDGQRFVVEFNCLATDPTIANKSVPAYYFKMLGKKRLPWANTKGMLLVSVEGLSSLTPV